MTNAKSPSQKTVLVVDDNQDLAELVVNLLVDEGYKVQMASNGIDGLEIALETRPNYVITDYRMPGMDGIQLINRLKQADAFQPFIFLTTADVGFDPELAYAMGAEAVHLKPFAVQDIFSSIQRFAIPTKDYWAKEQGDPEIGVSWSVVVNHEQGFFRSLSMGRGGIVLTTDDPPVLNQRMGFSIDIHRSEIRNLTGSGRVRWVTDELGGRARVGLEFEYIEGKERETLLDMIQTDRSLRAYIPSELAEEF